MAKKVLLIDYEAHSLDRVRGVLREPDYEVVGARDGEEALNTFSSARFDLVLLSGMLPRLPSAEVIREIRRRGGPVAPPILLMVSGYKGSNPKADAQRVGAFDLLARPFSDESLQQVAARALADTVTAPRIPAGSERAAASLTSSDIFSDILEEVAREAAPAPALPPRPSSDTQDEVEKRLRDTLAGVLPKPLAAPAKAPPRSSANEDVERLLSQTLSGLRTQPRPRPAAPPAPRLEASPAGASPAVASRASAADRFGQYEILEPIASGGMAELFRARLSGAEGFQKIVAIKKILPHISGDEEFLTMFADEAKLAAQLSHPNIVHIFDLGKIETGGYFIAMEHVDGRDLRSILHLARETGVAIPVPLAVLIAAKIAAALDYAHRKQADDGKELHIVHRDVSPSNILVSTNGDIKLCDFGVAKAASKVSRTESGALKGKVPYMSPEQAWGRALDRRSDLYSLGSVLFEMLTGRKLFVGDSDLSVLEKVRAGEIVAPSTLNPAVPRPLDEAVVKALAREPEKRYSSASDLLRDLEAVLRTYEPPPSSADLAVYVRHVESEDAARSKARAEAAAAPMPSPPPPPARPSKKSERARREVRVPLREAPPAPEASKASPPPAIETAPAPPKLAAEVYAAATPETEAEKRRRVRLYGMIAAASVLLVLGIFLVVRKPAAKPAPAAAARPVASTPVAVASVTTPIPTVGPAAVDTKAIQEEAQRQLAARRKEMQQQKEQQKAAAPAKAPAREVPVAASAASAPAPPANVQPTSPPLPEPTPQVKVAEAEPSKVEPAATSSPAEPSPAPVAAPVRSEAPDVSRGELVGPGPGVVEPAIVSVPRVSYPPAVKPQVVPGKAIVLVLVNEDGAVANVRLQQGVTAKLVNDAVLEAVRTAKFRPATKNGIPVKMWRTVVIDVRP